MSFEQFPEHTSLSADFGPAASTFPDMVTMMPETIQRAYEHAANGTFTAGATGPTSRESKNSPVTSTRVDMRVMGQALLLSGGDKSRLQFLPDGSIIIHN